MEEQLLPLAELRPAYRKAVWLYVYRDFSKSPADLAAERVALRLGMTAYPQHFLVDPATLERLADTGRAVGSFLAAVDRARVGPAGSLDPAKRIREADARAASLEKSGSVEEARRALADGDPLVRIRAMEVLAAKDPGAVVPRAAELLAAPNDPLRFLACEALRKAARPEAAKALLEVVREPKESLNPNVLRIRAVEALGACGDASCVEGIRPHAASGEFRNGLTRIAVDALAAIAGRDPKAKAPVRDALAASYPEPAPDAGSRAACLALAKAVHGALEKVTGRRVPFPADYDAAARERLARAWR
jgi:HEAT repeat protein